MPAARTGPARLARASVVAATTVALALVAHVLGGGRTPDAIVLVPLAALALAAAVPFTGRRIGSLRAVGLLGIGQLGLHKALELLGGMGCAPADAMAGHLHSQQVVQVACAAPAPHTASALGVATGLAMLVLHVVATVVTALLIAGTERALTWVATWLRPLVALLVPVGLPASAPVQVLVETPRAVGRRGVGVVPLRGPPTPPAHVTLAA